MWKPLAAAILLVFSCWPSADALTLVGGRIPSVAVVAPCDLVTCAEAYSLTRRMIAGYSGNLFQLRRTSDSTTLNVGVQVNGDVDTSGIRAFCASTSCLIYEIFGQINGNTLFTHVPGAALPEPACGTDAFCAPRYFVDPANGLPVARTVYPGQFYSINSPATGITAGTNPLSVMMYGHNSGHGSCCGNSLGVAHIASDCCFVGTDFILSLGYDNPGGGNQISAGTSTTFAIVLDEEGAGDPGDATGDYSSALTYISAAVTWTGAAGTNKIAGYANSSTPLYTMTPTDPLNLSSHGTTMRIGGGGDLTPTDSIFQEGIITNSALSSGQIASLQSNTTAFYAAHSPDTCASTADFGWFFHNPGGTSGEGVMYGSTAVAYALRRMSASYFGAIATLRDSVGTSNTYGPASSGCGIDPAAATFCAANPPCTVSKLFNQGTYNSLNVGTWVDTALDMLQATVINQPTVTFSGLNGLPVMNFNGSQWMCSTGTLTTIAFREEVIGAVAQRTGNTGAINPVLNTISDSTYLGFAAAANEITYNASTGSMTSGATVNDNTWHSLVWEAVGSGSGVTTSQPATLYASGVSKATTAAAALQDSATSKFCIGSDGSQSHFLTGKIAEVTVGNNDQPGALYTGSAVQSTLFAKQQAVWGTLN